MKKPVRWFSQFLKTRVCMATASSTQITCASPSPEASEWKRAGAQPSTHVGSFWRLTRDTLGPHFHQAPPGLAGVWDANLRLLCAGLPHRPHHSLTCSPTRSLLHLKAWGPLVFNRGCTHWHQQRGCKTSRLDKSSHVETSNESTKIAQQVTSEFTNTAGHRPRTPTVLVCASD